MTIPALAALKGNFPDASLTVLARPWVSPVYGAHPAVDKTMSIERDGRHKGLSGIRRLAAEVKQENFDLAVLFQNAFEAALIARLAGIPDRLGYNTDARGFLLNKSVKIRPEDKKVHETEYYLRILERAGLKAEWSRPVFYLGDEDRAAGAAKIEEMGASGSFLIGMAPGAAYGTAKQWPADRFAKAADAIIKRKGGAALIFGSPSERDVAGRVKENMASPAHNLAGRTSLTEAAALINKCDLFLTNDSGLMHLAAAVDTPLIAVFGSTNPATTSPAARKFRIIRHEVDCAPCLKQKCDQPTHRCMELVSYGEVAEAALEILG